MNAAGPRRRASSFSLALLFFFVSLWAILLAMSAAVVPAIARGQMGWSGLATTLGVSLGGGVLGAVVGLYHYRRGRGLGWGLLTGLAVGLCVGPLVLSTDYARVVVAGLGGSFLLLLQAAIYRLGQS